MKHFKYIKQLHGSKFWKYFIPYLKRGYKLTKDELPYILNESNFYYIKKHLTNKQLLNLLKHNPEILECL